MPSSIGWTTACWWANAWHDYSATVIDSDTKLSIGQQQYQLMLASIGRYPIPVSV